MKRVLLAFVAFTLPSMGIAAPDVGAPHAAAVLKGIQGFYGEAKDLKANFTQIYTYTVYARKQESKGTVFFKKPGKMRWDYQTPAPKVFVADGEMLWVYEPTENQVFKRSMKSAQLPVALTFMSGKGDLAEAFNAKLLKPLNDKTLRVELVPKVHEGDYKALRLTVDKTSFAVVSSTVVDPVGNTNQIIFENMRSNVGLPDAGFVFKVPAGTRVISQPR